MVYPYYGYFVSMDKLSSVVFSKFLEDRFFEENNEKFIVSSRRSVGGCVMLNRESFRNAGKENERFTSWGPEDIERYIRMKILGYKIKRVAGPLYHMHHERGKNSGYRDPEKYIAFIEEYRKVFNMKKKELEEYVSTW
jgi:predicted glycosyltransferase involved in capsule biosynthesis